MAFVTRTPDVTAPLAAKSGWIVAFGALYVIVGLIALGSVAYATAASVFVVGIMMIIAGAGEIIGAFQIRSWGKFILLLIVGLLFILGGVAAMQNPLLAAGVLTLMLGAALVASGIMRIAMAFAMKEETSWGWVALSGVLTLLLGIIILARWPVSSVYTLGIFLGVDLLIIGLTWIGAGLGLKRSYYQGAPI